MNNFELSGEDNGYDTTPARPATPTEPTRLDILLAAKGITPADPDGPIPF